MSFRPGYQQGYVYNYKIFHSTNQCCVGINVQPRYSSIESHPISITWQRICWYSCKLTMKKISWFFLKLGICFLACLGLTLASNLIPNKLEEIMLGWIGHKLIGVGFHWKYEHSYHESLVSGTKQEAKGWRGGMMGLERRREMKCIANRREWTIRARRIKEAGKPWLVTKVSNNEIR